MCLLSKYPGRGGHHNPDPIGCSGCTSRARATELSQLDGIATGAVAKPQWLWSAGCSDVCHTEYSGLWRHATTTEPAEGAETLPLPARPHLTRKPDEPINGPCPRKFGQAVDCHMNVAASHSFALHDLTTAALCCSVSAWHGG